MQRSNQTDGTYNVRFDITKAETKKPKQGLQNKNILRLFRKSGFRLFRHEFDATGIIIKNII